MTNQEIRVAASRRLREAEYPARRLAFVFLGATFGVNILLELLGLLVDNRMNAHVGLGQLQSRMVLSFIEMMASTIVMFAMPFWNLGYTGAALRTARGEYASPKSLLSGFRVIFPAVIVTILQLAIFMILAFASIQVATILYVMMPGTDSTMVFLEQMMKNATVIDEALAMEIMKLLWPVYALAGVLFLTGFVIVSYRLRLVDFQLMDGQYVAFRNLLNSNRKMRGNCFRFFRLELHFWWYFLLQGVASAISAVSLMMPKNPLVYWGAFLVGGLLQLILGALFLPKVMTTYAVAYDVITKEKEQVI